MSLLVYNFGCPLFFFFNDTATTEIYTLSLHDALPISGRASRLGFDGSVNFALLLAVVALVLMSGLWRTDAGLVLAGTHVGLPGLVRDAGLIVVALLSLRLTPRSVHQANELDRKSVV